VMGAMKQLTRLGLFVKTIEAFLFKLKRIRPRRPELLRRQSRLLQVSRLGKIG